jgi:hypothetical protein
MPNFSESVSLAGAVFGSFPGFFGGSDDYVPSDVDMLSDRSSSSPFSTFRTRARAARRGGAGSSKARCSPSPVFGQIRSGPSPRASKRTDPKGDKRAMPYLGYVRNALNGNSIGQCFNAFDNNRCWFCRFNHRCNPW